MIDQDDTGVSGAPPLASTGPQGHHARMRTRLLHGGPDSLTDCELLEMLLFLGIPRRNTKPLAKTLIHRFSDLYFLLTTPPADLRYFGQEPTVIGLFTLVREAARRLADAQAVSRPLLSDTERLLAYLDLPLRLGRPAHLAALLLNTRNQLLAEVSCPGTQDADEIIMTVMRRALETHATAIILVTCRPGLSPAASARDINLNWRIECAVAVLGITLHVHMIFGAGWHFSVKRQASRPAFDILLLPVEVAGLAAVESTPHSALISGFSEGQQSQFLQATADFPGSVAEPASADAHPADTHIDAAELRTLGDTELLAHLLGLVLPTGAPEAAREAVAQLGGFKAVLAAPELKLRQLPGLGTHSIAAIKLLHAAALRLLRGEIMDQRILDGSGPLIDYLTAVLGNESIEHFRVLFLDAQNRLRADEAQTCGTADHLPVYPREVARRALELRAASIILVHNHPSGDPSPSPSDLEMTAIVAEAVATVGVIVRDHIIVCAGRWFSFRNEGMLGNR